MVGLNPASTSSEVGAGNVEKKAPMRVQRLVQVPLRKSLPAVLLNPVRREVLLQGLSARFEKYVAKSPCGFSPEGPLFGIAAKV